jgi:cytochrome oxidase Cu insertion factor (SCO1/SenC/PrrC family)
MRSDRSDLRTAVLLIVVFGAACRQAQPLPVLFAVPAATLTTDAGKPLHLRDLNNHVTVYDFIFTRCAATCPVMTRSMQSLTRELPDQRVRFVSISVDPAHDSPERLRRYAAGVRSDGRWVFLTGDREQIVNLSVKGFKLAAGDPGPKAEPILHSSKFVVADQQGMIRGYYDGTSAEDLKRLARDVRSLLRRS